MIILNKTIESQKTCVATVGLPKHVKLSKLTPWMRPVNNESFKENSGDLLLNGLLVGLGEQVQQCAREVVSVAVGVPQLQIKLEVFFIKQLLFIYLNMINTNCKYNYRKYFRIKRGT